MRTIAAKITPELCAGQVLENIPLVMRFIRAEMRSQGKPLLSVPQLRTMIFLNRYPGASLSSVAEHLGVTKATASTLVEKLVQRGLVDRSEHPQERRRHVLTLTDSGMQLFQKVREATRTSIATVLASLPEEKLVKIAEGLALLGDIFKEVPLPGDG